MLWQWCSNICFKTLLKEEANITVTAQTSKFWNVKAAENAVKRIVILFWMGSNFKLAHAAATARDHGE